MVLHLRHGLGVVATGACAAVGALVVLTSPADEVPGAALRSVGVLALVALLGAVPLVRVDARGVLVRNPWRTWFVGWRALDEAGFGWSLWLRPRGGRRPVRALAAPGPARMRALYERHLTEGGVIERDVVLTAATSMAPALLAVRQGRERWARGAEASDEVRTGWCRAGLVLTVAGAATLVAGVLAG